MRYLKTYTKLFENNTDESFIETLKDICFDITDNLPLRCDVESGYMVLRVVISKQISFNVSIKETMILNFNSDFLVIT